MAKKVQSDVPKTGVDRWREATHTESSVKPGSGKKRVSQTVARSIDVNPPPQAQPESLEDFLAAVEHDVQRFHDPAPDALRRVVCAPTTPTWSVPVEHLRPIADEARRLGIRLHSHLSETADYVRYTQEVHGCSPVDFVEQHGWIGEDVWYAHLVHLSPREVEKLARTGTGMAD